MDPKKLRQWPRYAASKWLRYGCPIHLLVICPDKETADWDARPIHTTLHEYTHRPTILRFTHVPGSTRGEQLMALKARGLNVSEGQRELIDARDNLATLKGWAETALTAETADEVFR